jgi:hypothetical protein
MPKLTEAEVHKARILRDGIGDLRWWITGYQAGRHPDKIFLPDTCLWQTQQFLDELLAKSKPKVKAP